MIDPAIALKELLNKTDREVVAYQTSEDKEAFWDKQIQEQIEHSRQELHKSIKKANRLRNKYLKSQLSKLTHSIHYRRTNKVTKNNEPVFTDGNNYYILQPDFNMQLITI